MKINIKRFAFKLHYTIGKLYINGDYYCDTLEPFCARVNINTSPNWIRKKKRDCGCIAIPSGEYRIKMEASAKFHKRMPFLVDVPAFKGVMLHPGNYPKDTCGCILPGWNRRKGMVCGSISAFTEICHRMDKAFADGEKVTVKVEEK